VRKATFLLDEHGRSTAGCAHSWFGLRKKKAKKIWGDGLRGRAYCAWWNGQRIKKVAVRRMEESPSGWEKDARLMELTLGRISKEEECVNRRTGKRFHRKEALMTWGRQEGKMGITSTNATFFSNVLKALKTVCRRGTSRSLRKSQEMIGDFFDWKEFEKIGKICCWFGLTYFLRGGRLPMKKNF